MVIRNAYIVRIAAGSADLILRPPDNDQRIVGGGRDLQQTVLRIKRLLLQDVPLRIADINVVGLIVVLRLAERNGLVCIDIGIKTEPRLERFFPPGLGDRFMTGNALPFPDDLSLGEVRLPAVGTCRAEAADLPRVSGIAPGSPFIKKSD